MNVRLIATSAFGLESVVARELRSLGYENGKAENGRVLFTADLSAICRCNLWLRSADRLLVQIGQFPARSFEELFEGTKQLPWSDWLPENANFPVQGKSIKSRLFSVSDCQAIVKKAVVESLKKRYRRQWFVENGPRYKIEVSLLDDIATLTLDSSGPGLHKRGYRQLSHTAPLKETLAAALVQLSRWKPDRAFIDPFCGSGTIAIEAAMLGRNIAPGLMRHFDAQDWPTLSTSRWSQALQEARDLACPRQRLGIFGFDIDPEAVRMARYHSSQAGLGAGLHWEARGVKDVYSRFHYGYVVTNPPYGERLAEPKGLNVIYQDLKQLFMHLDTWSMSILSADLNLEKSLKKKGDKKRKLYNGRILCNLYQFYGPKPDSLTGPFGS
ncbi:MAG: class I SAM-dependent RNA methyltransferase [Syntrophomonadaceae bacterium]